MPISEHIIEEENDDSLNPYEEDFEDFEEDKEMDIREQERKSVKELFATTLKTINLKNDSEASQISSPPNLKSKYALTLSEIKEKSNEGGSILSRNEDLDD